MEALWRWTSSVFLVLALNIGCIHSQNVGPNCPLPAQTLQVEILRDCNLGLVSPPPQMNKMFLNPLDGLAQGEVNALELQRQAFQQANIPILDNSCANQFFSNEQALLIGAGPNLPGSCLSFRQTIVPQNQCLMGSLAPSCVQQNAGLETLLPPQGPFLPQSMLPGPLSTLSGPLIPFTSAPDLGVDICPGLREEPSPCSRLDPSPYPNILSNLGYHFTPLVPINPGFSAPVRCEEAITIPLQGVALPPPQEISQMCAPNTPFATLNNQGVFMDDVNCLPRTLGPQCDVSLEPLSCPLCPPPVGPSQNILPFPQFRLPRPSLFQPFFQGPLTNNLPIQCEVNDRCPSTNILEPVCVNTAQIQQEPICPLRPITSAYCEPNLQFSPLQASTITPFISNPCTMIPEKPPNSCLPPLLPQSCTTSGFAGILPQVTNSANYLLPPVLASAFNGPSIDSCGICSPVITEASPTPINLQINVPPPVIPAPRITIINATPAPVSTATDSNVYDMPYPMPPMIIEGDRSSSRSWLPLILVALFAGDGSFGGCGGCNSDPIPIPYPIPIPTNNPVIVQ